MTTLLKNDTTVEDPRLDRLVHFDPKSRNFPVRTVIRADQPRSYSWGCDIVLDQGAEGACVGFSVAHELRAKPKVAAGISQQTAMALYHRAQQLDEWAGGSYPGASPRYEGTSVLAGVKAAQELGFVKEYRWAFGVDDLALAVSRKGPAILGIAWYDSMYEPTLQDGLWRIGVTGNVVGGHAILCVGFNVRLNAFLLHNSWGPDWGKNGRAWVSYAEMDTLLRNDGEACIPVLR